LGGRFDIRGGWASLRIRSEKRPTIARIKIREGRTSNMSTRLAVFLGIVAIGAAMGIVGVAQPAAADLFFGETDNGLATGTCINHVPSIPNCGGADGGGSVLGPIEPWSGGTGPITVQSRGFLKSDGSPINQFIDPMTAANPDQSGIGIAPPTGGFDREINVLSYDTLLVTNPSHAFSGTISIDSLQPGETARVCAEPTQFVFGGVNCQDSTLNGAVTQELTLPAGYSPANPWLAVDTFGSVLSDVKIEDLDVAVSVPEPGTVALLLTGIGGLFIARRRIR
jgi:hypothetical protein